MIEFFLQMQDVPSNPPPVMKDKQATEIVTRSMLPPISHDEPKSADRIVKINLVVNFLPVFSYLVICNEACR